LRLSSLRIRLGRHEKSKLLFRKIAINQYIESFFDETSQKRKKKAMRNLLSRAVNLKSSTGFQIVSLLDPKPEAVLWIMLNTRRFGCGRVMMLAVCLFISHICVVMAVCTLNGR